MALQLDLKAQGESRHSEECTFQVREAITATSRQRKNQGCLIISKENKLIKVAEDEFGNLSLIRGREFCMLVAVLLGFPI